MQERFEKFIFYTALETDDGQKNCCRQKGKCQVLSKIRRGFPPPEENVSSKIPITPISIKKIKRTILIFLGKNFNFIKPFDIISFVILRPLACGAVLLFPHNLARQHSEEE